MRKLNLQLFANSSTKSSSSTSSQGGSSTTGGSSTSTQGGSTSDTTSHSETDTHTEGGSHSYSYGKSWASGKVEDNTQQHRDTYNTDYSEGQKVTDAYNRLQETLNNKPSFESKYQEKLDSLYDSIMNRDKFSYNFNADQMYQMYKDQYTAQGKQAMEDTMGKANAMNGGYGSSYGQSAAQQTYQGYLQQLNNIIPTLRDQAYQQYQDEGTEMLNKYNITSDAYEREYGQYRDDVSDWQNDRSFNYGMYSDERNYDYNMFTNERDYWNDEYWNEKNAERSNYQVTDSNYWEDSHSVTDSESHTSSNYWENSNTNSWNNTSNWSKSNTNSSSNTWSDSGSSGSGGSTSKSSGGTSLTGGWGNDDTQSNWEVNIAPYNTSKTQNLQADSKEDVIKMVSAMQNAQSSADLAKVKYNLRQAGYTQQEIEILEDYAKGERTFK